MNYFLENIKFIILSSLSHNIGATYLLVILFHILCMTIIIEIIYMHKDHMRFYLSLMLSGIGMLLVLFYILLPLTVNYDYLSKEILNIVNKKDFNKSTYEEKIHYLEFYLELKNQNLSNNL